MVTTDKHSPALAVPIIFRGKARFILIKFLCVIYIISDISISDPLFAGEHSYMSLTLESAVRFNTELSIEIRPDSLDGLVIHFGQSRDAR